jgi:hypothetical protein
MLEARLQTRAASMPARRPHERSPSTGELLHLLGRSVLQGSARHKNSWQFGDVSTIAAGFTFDREGVLVLHFCDSLIPVCFNMARHVPVRTSSLSFRKPRLRVRGIAKYPTIAGRSYVPPFILLQQPDYVANLQRHDSTIARLTSASAVPFLR